MATPMRWPRCWRTSTGLGIRSIFNLGDHVSGPLAPRETAALAMARAGMVSIRGNHDRWVVAGGENMYPSDAFARAELDAAQLAWLEGLPPTRRLGDVFLCHGTPRDDLEYWMETVVAGRRGRVSAAWPRSPGPPWGWMQG